MVCLKTQMADESEALRLAQKQKQNREYIAAAIRKSQETRLAYLNQRAMVAAKSNQALKCPTTETKQRLSQDQHPQLGS